MFTKLTQLTVNTNVLLDMDQTIWIRINVNYAQQETIVQDVDLMKQMVLKFVICAIVQHSGLKETLSLDV